MNIARWISAYAGMMVFWVLCKSQSIDKFTEPVSEDTDSTFCFWDSFENGGVSASSDASSDSF